MKHRINVSRSYHIACVRQPDGQFAVGEMAGRGYSPMSKVLGLFTDKAQAEVFLKEQIKRYAGQFASPCVTHISK